VIIHNFPTGTYFVHELANRGFITAFDIDSGGWFTAPNGISRMFTLTSDIIINSFNSIVPEIPGEPSRPFDPNNPWGLIKSPQTGDSRGYILPLAMLLFGIFCIAGAACYRRRLKSTVKKDGV